MRTQKMPARAAADWAATWTWHSVELAGICTVASTRWTALPHAHQQSEDWVRSEL